MNVIGIQTDPAAPPGSTSLASTVGEEGGGCNAAPGLPITLGEWRRSVWLPLLLKAGGVAALLATLAGIGTLSILHGAGVRVTDLDTRTAGLGLGAASAAVPLANSPGVTWLAPVHDGPSRTAPSTAPLAHPHDADRGTGVTSDGRVVLNVATADELTRIPGIGQKRAEAILALRAKLGKFKKLAELLRVRGIGPRSLKKIAAHVVLDPPPPPADGGA